jgi:hypothetical protein
LRDLLRLALTPIGREHIIQAIEIRDATPALVNFISLHSELSESVIHLLAYVLPSSKIQDAVLRTQAIPLLISYLTSNDLGTLINATCALAILTRSDAGKYKVVECGAMIPLVAALSHSTPTVKKMAVNAVHNMASVNVGRRAAYDANAVQPLVALLDPHSGDTEFQRDVLKALDHISTLDRAAREDMNRYGAFGKLKGFQKNRNGLQGMAESLRERLR